MGNGNGLIGNLLWKFAERISAQLISLIVSIVLARLLEPEHYGIISIVLVFIAIVDVFVSDGLGSALIQKREADATDFFSVLYFNIGLSCLLYLVMFVCAPIIASFYGNGYEILKPVLRVLGLRIVLTAVNSVQNAYISKKMLFKKFFLSTLVGVLASAIVGIGMAYAGYGVWALVAQYLTNTLVGTLILTIVLKKKPKFIFSFRSIKELFPYGVRILASGLLLAGYQELRALIIGKVYSPADLAYYDKGRQFPNLICTNISTSVGAVLFPKMSQEQDDREKIKTTTRNSIRLSAYVMCPMMLGLAAVAESLITLVLTEKWLPSVPLLRLFCIIYLFHPLHIANMQAIKAIGRSDVYLRLEIVKKIIELFCLLLVMRISVYAITVSMAVCTIFFIFVNAYPNTKLLNYKIKEQLKDIFPSLIMSFIMFVCVDAMNNINIVAWFKMFLQCVVGAMIYILLSVITRNDEFRQIKEIILKR